MPQDHLALSVNEFRKYKADFVNCLKPDLMVGQEYVVVQVCCADLDMLASRQTAHPLTPG